MHRIGELLQDASQISPNKLKGVKVGLEKGPF